MKYLGTVEPIKLDVLWDVPCIRCGSNSQCQWAICANNSQYLPLCLECDLALNRLILMFMNVEPDKFLADYRGRLISQGSMDASSNN